MKKFYDSLREHAMKIINFERSKMILVKSKEYELYLNQASCHICRKKSLQMNTILGKIMVKLDTIFIIRKKT